MRLAIGLATRGRPQLLGNTLQTTLANIARPNTVLTVALDEDDRHSVELVLAMARTDNRLFADVRTRPDTIAAKWNRVLETEATVYLPMCDDRPVVTPGFDEKILAAADLFPDKIGVVFNHLDNLSFTSIQAVTRHLVDLMGGVIYVEHFPFWFVDHWLSDVAEMIDRVAFADVRLDYSVNPGTQEMREPAWWATFYDACKLRRHAIARRIFDSGVFATAEWQKRILVDRFPLIDGYSKMINDGVRTMRVADTPPDARYLRVKAAAQALLKAEILPELEAAA